MELFSFPFLFLSFCHSIIYRVVSIVSDSRNQSSFVLFYEVFESLYGCVNAVFDAGNSTSSRFSWYIESVNVVSARELKKLWNMKVTIITIVIGAFGTVTKGLLKSLEDLEVGGGVETIQTVALLKTARILRRVLET